MLPRPTTEQPDTMPGGVKDLATVAFEPDSRSAPAYPAVLPNSDEPANAQALLAELAPAHPIPLFTAVGNVTGDQRCPFQCCPAGRAALFSPALAPSAHALVAVGATIAYRALSVRSTTRHRWVVAVLAPADQVPLANARQTALATTVRSATMRAVPKELILMNCPSKADWPMLAPVL